ncbi:hypothetical protein GCM10010112_83750 [Actinoplanes lobatus]|uniref:Uncharacterized protein n=1 Tax=Actinoplanes lobatus TaxID=113568 RepID=A0A7W7HKQ2_9ACTN|nr:hypothetical protein [Actinoplanes lobatus]MBB4752331.1 hypothetical protein [Actinoplanes lobatus]GGN94427.1 hypothetical protein GCM10010112_83750 [Actinoplanes lobatus]GIE46017.1 hypothetical protein Alo02nite_89150 [Actinoplanes lobatus]
MLVAIGTLPARDEQLVGVTVADLDRLDRIRSEVPSLANRRLWNGRTVPSRS